MEKQMTLTANPDTCKKNLHIVRKTANMLNAPIRLMGRYYSHVLGTEINLRQARAMTEAQLAFFATVMPADFSVLLRAAACAWFILSIKKCQSLF